MLIAIEGIDGSGKGTQSRLLVERLARHGERAKLLSFPMYTQHFFGGEVGRYLNGDFGELGDVHPKLAALLYAGDRYEASAPMKRDLDDGVVLVSDRYTGSNAAHQGARLAREDRARFLTWVETLEFDVFRIPRPDLVILLDLPESLAQQNVLQKAARSYTSRKADIHERDQAYLGAVRDAYLELATQASWAVIPCEQDGLLRPIADIADDVWAAASSASRAGPKLPDRAV
jgi:dTMP kinase